MEQWTKSLQEESEGESGTGEGAKVPLAKEEGLYLDICVGTP